MSRPFAYLTSVTGLEFRFSCPRNDFYMAFLLVGGLTLSSNSVHYVLGAGGKDFTLYFENSFLDFPISELPKLKEFLLQANLAKAAA